MTDSQRWLAECHAIDTLKQHTRAAALLPHTIQLLVELETLAMRHRLGTWRKYRLEQAGGSVWLAYRD